MNANMWRWVLLLGVLVAARADATAWHVTAGADSSIDLVGAAVRQAADGDTILVGPGTYYEHIPVGPKSLLIRGTDDAQATILDGSREIPGRQGSIVYADIGDSRITISGLSFRGGTGAIDWLTLGGGAIALWSRVPGGAVHIEDCDFRENRLPFDWNYHHFGGAIYLDGIADGTIRRCNFSSNFAGEGDGGHISVTGGDIVVEECEFSLSEVEGMLDPIPGISNDGSNTFTLSTCRFVGASSLDSYASVYSTSEDVTIAGNEFLDQESNLARRVQLVPLTHNDRNIRLTGNVFSGTGSASEGIDIYIGAFGGSAELLGNTFAKTSIALGLVGGTQVEFARNILFEAEGNLVAGGGGVVRCNDVWPDSLTIPCCDVVLEDNVSADPLFCNQPGGDLSIAQESVCAEANGPEGCGTIGARGVACKATRVEEATWGRIKHLFR